MSRSDGRYMTREDALENFIYDPETGNLFLPERYGKSPLQGKCSSGYIRVFFRGHRYRAHRIIMLMVNGRWPDHVDHLNHDRSDNRLSNLKESNYCENSKNRSKRSDNTSGVCGVRYNEKKKRYIAQVVLKGKHMFYKSFNDIESAKNAVIKKRAELKFNENHGE